MHSPASGWCQACEQVVPAERKRTIVARSPASVRCSLRCPAALIPPETVQVKLDLEVHPLQISMGELLSGLIGKTRIGRVPLPVCDTRLEFKEGLDESPLVPPADGGKNADAVWAADPRMCWSTSAKNLARISSILINSLLTFAFTLDQGEDRGDTETPERRAT